jgi:hypothetical protein
MTPMTDTAPTPSRLWKRMTAEQRLAAAHALWRDDETKDEQAQAATLIAQQLKFRTKTVNGLDADRKARYFAGVPALPDALAARMLVVYHLAEQRPMMAAFLDALGIAHDNGLIHEESVSPDPAKIPGAAAAIARQYPATDVSIYLSTLLFQDPTAWAPLRDVPELSKEAT